MMEREEGGDRLLSLSFSAHFPTLSSILNQVVYSQDPAIRYWKKLVKNSSKTQIQGSENTNKYTTIVR